ncbi:hypothetical protein LOD99_5407 [Oopsacas minuta]|uniref:Transposase n=1 Tax=Oopsacas minuta TaxID=111878 RepID=A0AAV7JSA8_9METZ|nr:hypothetical protein LOD99_5407 [Oopsacas minuta]
MKPLSVMIWAGVSAVGRTPLIFVPAGVKINAKTYKDLTLEPVAKDLSQTMFSGQPFIFQHDGAPAHTAIATQDCLICLSTPSRNKGNIISLQGAEFQQHFREKNGLMFCPNVEGILLAMGVPNYNPSDWRLFIDSSKRSLKCVLLHNGNIFGSILKGYSIKLKEEYHNVKEILEIINYSAHDWVICVDLKMVNFLLGQRSGFTKYPCFLCYWDSRDRNQHWIREKWPPRECLKVGEKM